MAIPRGTLVSEIGSIGLAPPIWNLASTNPASTPQKSCLFGSNAMSIHCFCESCPDPALNVSLTASAESSRLMFRPSAMIMPPTIGVGKDAGVLTRHSAGFGVIGSAQRASTGGSSRIPHAVPGLGNVGDNVVAVAASLGVFAVFAFETVRGLVESTET